MHLEVAQALERGRRQPAADLRRIEQVERRFERASFAIDEGTVLDMRRQRYEQNRGDDGALPIRASARVLGATVKAGETLTYTLDPSRHAYLVSSAGVVEVGGVRLDPRDGAAITGESEIVVTAVTDAEVVMVDAA